VPLTLLGLGLAVAVPTALCMGIVKAEMDDALPSASR
jgi:hypothetical protein